MAYKVTLADVNDRPMGVGTLPDGSQSAPIPVGGAQNVAGSGAIANGAALSAGIDLGTARLGAIQMPAAWTTAALTFQASLDGVTYQNVYDATGAEYTVQVAASRYVIVPLVDFLSIRYLMIRSGTSTTPVNQGAARTLGLVLVP